MNKNTKKNPFENPSLTQENNNNSEINNTKKINNQNPFQNNESAKVPPKASNTNINTFQPNLNTNYNDFEQPQYNNYPQNQTQNQLHGKFSNPYSSIQNNNVSQSDFDITLSEFESKYKMYNCSYEFISPTTNVFPINNNLLSEISFPIGLNISPLSISNTQIPIVDYGEKNIPRCPNNNCRAYLNPFVKFIDGGDKWICNICKQINITEEYYYGNLDNNNERVDKNNKYDLCCGSYEFLANKQYWKNNKNPTIAYFIFLIETSFSSISNGFLTATIESIKDVINNESFYNGNDVKLTFITYDSNVHFYSYNNKMNQPQMLCVADEPVFVPTVKENLTFNLKDNKDKILQILDLIQNTFVSNSCKDSNKIFSALNGAYLLGRGLGGKILIFSSSNSLSSNNKLISEIDKTKTKEQIAYSTHDKRQLGNMGINLTNENISCDIFACAENPIYVYTLNQLCEYSNGNIYFYKNFNLDLHYKNIFNQIRKVLTRPICWEGVLRTRFSHGYKIQDFITPVLISNKDLFIFPTYDSDQHYQIGINMIQNNENNNLYNNDNFIFIQSALLYSFGDGQRRIRVHNLCLPLSNRARDIYNGINAEYLASYYLKQTIDKIYKTKNISNAIISTETLFKTFISVFLNSSQSMKKELIENIQFLPIYMLGMIKHRIFCKDEIERNYDIDLSNYLRIKLQRMSSEEILPYIYPNIYPIHELMNDTTLGQIDNETGIPKIPNIIATRESEMSNDGLYLIDNGYLLVIYVRKNVNPFILKSLFEVDDLQYLSINVNEENVFGNLDDFKERIMNIIDYIRGGKSLFQNLIFAFEGTSAEKIVKESLIEDNNCVWYKMDYDTFYKRCIG